MNALEKFHSDLDQNSWDVKQESDINQALQKVNKELFEAGLLGVLHFAEIDRQAFNFSKSPDERLSFRVAGTSKMEDGSEIPFEWPDIREFNGEDFDYLYNRFKSTKNTYAKTEYGLVLFYSRNKLDNDFVIELLTALFELVKTYINKARPNNDKNHYILHSRSVLSNALFIADKRKSIEEIKDIFINLIIYTFDVHQTWDLSNHSILRVIIDFTNFAVQYYKDFSQTVDVSRFIDKNWEVAKLLTNSHVFGAIYIADISIKLSRKLDIDAKDWLNFKAIQFETLAIQKKDDAVSISFLEKAMSIYKVLKDSINLNRLQQTYQQLRTDFRLGEVTKEMPQDESQRIMQLIKKDVHEKSEEEIIKTLLFTPMIRPLEDIKKWNDDLINNNTFLNLLPVKIKDKFGNTVAQYVTEEERKKISLIRTYELHMQIATQTIIDLFIEAFRSNKISANGIISLLNQTWMGEKATRIVNGIETNFSYTKLVESGVNSLFNEMQRWKDDQNYEPNFVSATDSLVLKIEYFLREFCYFLDIVTFKERPNQETIIMEKTLDDLLNDLDGKLSADDHFFFKFVLTEKAGYNLRNKIAHGLMDDIEYSLQYPLFAMIIILKLANYQFVQTINE
jgi:hypothetical protein